MLVAALGVGAFLVLVLLTAMAWRVVVPTDHVHVVQRRKTSTAYGRGFADGNVYYKVPASIPYFGVKVSQLSTSIFSVPVNKYDAYDSARVPFLVDVIAFFQIEDAVETSRRVTDFSDLGMQLQNTMRGAIRRVLAGSPINEIMGSRSTLNQEFFKEVQEQTKNWGIKLNSIEFMNIEDYPGTKVITNIMDKERTTIEKESRMRVAENIQAAELAEINAKQAVELQQINARQTVELKDVERQRTVDVNKQKASQTVQEEAAKTATAEAATAQVKVVRAQEIEKNRLEVAADANAEVQKRTALGQATAAKTQATGYRDAKVLEAEGDAAKVKQTGTAEADVIAAKGLATAEAQAKLAEALAKMDDAAINAKLVEAMVAMNAAKFAGLAAAYQNADVKIVTSGQGPKLLGVDLNAESGANLATFIEALPVGLKEKAKKLAETLAAKATT